METKVPFRSVIAIDGPSGAGKGSVSRAIARALGCRYVDTGAMYRAVTWLAIQEGLSLDDEAALSALAGRAQLTLEETTVTVEGHDVTSAIRTREIDAAAARVARMPAVRAVLVARQRAYAADGRIVMEGRDIGTTVFPEADVKLYLDASPGERAARRASDPARESGISMSPFRMWPVPLRLVTVLIGRGRFRHSRWPMTRCLLIPPGCHWRGWWSGYLRLSVSALRRIRNLISSS